MMVEMNGTGLGLMSTTERTGGSEAYSNPGKVPRTKRGQVTQRKILDAALAEFGEKGFGESSIVSITQRAKVALGTFYTYFDSKEELFAALVQDMSSKVRDHVAPVFAKADGALDAERLALAAYLEFVRGHKEVYRIIDEAEFVDPDGFRNHYETTASRIHQRMAEAAMNGEIRAADDFTSEVRAWAIMGMNVFLGLRFGVWGEENPHQVADTVNRMISDGLAP